MLHFIPSRTPVRRSGMARVNEESLNFTCHSRFIHKWNELYEPSYLYCMASPHFSWYSFPISLRVGG